MSTNTDFMPAKKQNHDMELEEFEIEVLNHASDVYEF